MFILVKNSLLSFTAIYIFLIFYPQAGISPLVAGQLKDYVNEKMMNKKAKSLKKKNKGQLPIVSHRPRLVVIGQETVEPLIAFQAST